MAGQKNGGKSNGTDGVKHRSNGKQTNKEKNGRERKRHTSGDSEVSLQSADQYIPTPPDGGWGWVIVFCSFCLNVIVDGIGYTFGVFLIEFTQVFDAPKSKVSLVGSLLTGGYLFAGPIVSAMTNKLGCRRVVICGSILSTFAFVLSTFAPNIDMMCLTYGAMGGFGFGMMYLPAIVSVGYYFEKRRATATGLAVCGSGFGTFMFPPLTEFLMQQYGWKGAIMIIAGITFNGCIFGALMRPLEATPVKKEITEDLDDVQKRTRTMSECSTMADPNKIMAGVMEAKLLREKRLQDNDSDLGSLPSIAFVKRESTDQRKMSGGGIPIPGTEARRYKTSIGSSYGESTGTPIRDPHTNPSNVGSPSSNAPTIVVEDESEIPSPDEVKVIESSEPTDGTSTERSEYFTPPETNPNSPVKSMADSAHHSMSVDEEEMKEMSVIDDSHIDHNIEDKRKEALISQYTREVVPLLSVPPVTSHNGALVTSGGSRTNMAQMHHSLHSLHVSKKDLARPLYRKDIFYSGSILNMHKLQSQQDMRSYIASITTIPGEMDIVDSPSSSSKCINNCCFFVPRSARDVLSEMFDFSLLKDLGFMLICCGNFTAFLGFFIPFVYMVDFAVSHSIAKTEATFLISIIGITNTGGRVLAGKLADSGIMSSLMITWISIIIVAVCTALVPFCTSYALLATNAAIFGLGVAAYISLSSVIICDHMGLDKLTNAFGLMCLVRGTAGMVGSPFAGFLFDSSGSYHMSFIVGGLLLLAGAFCHMLLHLPCIKKKSSNNKDMIDMEETVAAV